MSRGPGAIERVIEAAFAGHPSGTFTVEELASLAYSGVNRVEKKHRVAVIRAAEKAATRCGWQGWKAERPGHPVVYLNRYDVRSYVVGRMRCDSFDGKATVEEIGRRFDDPSVPHSKWVLAQPGGAWWLHVEINKAVRDGRADDEATARAALSNLVKERSRALGVRV